MEAVDVALSGISFQLASQRNHPHHRVLMVCEDGYNRTTVESRNQAVKAAPSHINKALIHLVFETCSRLPNARCQCRVDRG